MPQHLDDRTGEPIRLSAKQRERQREAMVANMNQMILQMNALTQAVRVQTARIDSHDAALATLEGTYQHWRRLSFWERLRTLFVGLP